MACPRVAHRSVQLSRTSSLLIEPLLQDGSDPYQLVDHERERRIVANAPAVHRLLNCRGETAITVGADLGRDLKPDDHRPGDRVPVRAEDRGTGGRRAGFDAVSAANKQQVLWWVASAKRESTRADRIAKLVASAAERRNPLSARNT